MTARKRTAKPAPTPSQPMTSINPCTFEQGGIKHTEHTVRAIEAIARGLTANAEGLRSLANAVSGHGVTLAYTEPMIKIGGSQ